MSPSRYDIEIYQGDTWHLSLVLKDINDNPVNLTGYTAGFAIKDTPDSQTVLVSGTTADKIAIEPLAGKLEITLPAADTAGLQFFRAVYDLYLKSSAGTVTYLLAGAVNLRPRVAVAP